MLSNRSKTFLLDTQRERVRMRGEMRKQQIRVGVQYTDGKGNVREVIAVGPEYVLYPGQQGDDNLRYVVVKRFTGPNRAGDKRNCTRASFAAWAKGAV